MWLLDTCQYYEKHLSFWNIQSEKTTLIFIGAGHVYLAEQYFDN